MPDSHIAVPAIWFGTFQITTVKRRRTISANSRAMKNKVIWYANNISNNITV